MKKLFAVLFFYCLLVVLLLPFMVNLLFGGFGAGFPREAERYDGIKPFDAGNTSIGGVMEYEEERKQKQALQQMLEAKGMDKYDYILVNDVRNMYAYTGFYKGTKVTVFSSGMGIPSMGIYCYELYKFYEVENIIRNENEYFKIKEYIMKVDTILLAKQNTKHLHSLLKESN